MQSTLGLAHFWQQADGVIRLTAYLLLGMSILSWFLILWKLWGWWRVRSASRELDNFWSAPSIEFYKSLGAVLMDEWTVCRVGGPALRALAQGGR